MEGREEGLRVGVEAEREGGGSGGLVFKVGT